MGTAEGPLRGITDSAQSRPKSRDTGRRRGRAGGSRSPALYPWGGARAGRVSEEALSQRPFLRRAAGALAVALAVVLGVVGATVPAGAQGRLEARYSATLAGIPLGSGVWVIDVSDEQYTAVASGRTTGLIKLFTDGSGSGGTRGMIVAGQLVPQSYASTINSDRKTDQVRMALAGGNVKEALADPPLETSPDRVPVTDTHRRGVVDPMTAALVPVPGSGDLLTPDACKRKVAVFDGRQRAEVELVYKRMDRVKADKGYQGPVVVCTILYRPIAGHRPERAAIKYLIATRGMELWLAPMAGTRVLVPFRFSVPTPLGPGVLQATHFVAMKQPPHAARPQPAAAKVQ